MRVIGFTGGIASGKTMIVDYLSELGAPVVDADRVSRELTEPGSPVLADIAARFGQDYLDEQGSLRRKKLAALIFHDAAARRQLNELLHPLILGAIGQKLASLAAAGVPAVLLVAPLLFEAEMIGLTDEVWLVAATPQEQVRRLMARDGISLQAAQARLQAQSSLAEKMARADKIIDNNGDPQAAREAAGRLWLACLTEAQATADTGGAGGAKG